MIYLLSLQEPDIGPYTEVGKSNLQPQTLFEDNSLLGCSAT